MDQSGPTHARAAARLSPGRAADVASRQERAADALDLRAAVAAAFARALELNVTLETAVPLLTPVKAAKKA